jgi:glutathione reductase (NADPH)
MSTEKFDVVILGGGNAGIGVTGPVRRAGMSVAMIEADLLGGTCPNRGCTPKKVLVAAGHALHEIERAPVHHIAVGKPRLGWAALIDREKDLIKDIPDNLARSMSHRNVEGSGATASSLARMSSASATAIWRPSTSSSPRDQSRVRCRFPVRST